MMQRKIEDFVKEREKWRDEKAGLEIRLTHQSDWVSRVTYINILQHYIILS